MFKGSVWLSVCLTVLHAIKAYQITVQYILNLSGQLQDLAVPPPHTHWTAGWAPDIVGRLDATASYPRSQTPQ